MNRDRFAELKKRTEDTIARKDATAAHLQELIANCDAQILNNKTVMREAEENNDPDRYQAAFTLLNMLYDRRKKYADEQTASVRESVIPSGDWKEIVDFLQAESEKNAKEERAEISELLQKIAEVKSTHESYYTDLAQFAGECERVNKASYTGEYNLITVHHLPPHWTEEIERLRIAYFRPESL